MNTITLTEPPEKARYKVCVRYVTVAGLEMSGKTFQACEQSATHATLYCVATGERVAFSRKELL